MAAFFMVLIPPGSVIELEFAAVPRSFTLSFTLSMHGKSQWLGPWPRAIHKDSSLICAEKFRKFRRGSRAAGSQRRECRQREARPLPAIGR
jgi:hypothetical protein